MEIEFKPVYAEYKNIKRFFKKVCREVKIFYRDKHGKEIEIGRIFTPAGSGNDFKDAVQVCGFVEAYDYWGCGVYGKPIKQKSYTDKHGIIHHPVLQVKDIQLLFDKNVRYHSVAALLDGLCVRCYNEPCTCENKEGNPYTAKRRMDNRFLIDNLLKGKPKSKL